MSGKPAARVGDGIVCGLPQATPAALPHAPPPGMPIMPPGCINVLIGGKFAARMTDMSLCAAPIPTPNAILTGAFPVAIGNLPAARITDQGTHPGSVIMPPGCPTVIIGLAGTAGNLAAGAAMCQAAATGRSSGQTQQSYQNCGVESSRQVINQANGSTISENALLARSIINKDAGLARTASGGLDIANSGGTGAAGRRRILASSGVGSSIQQPTPRNLGMAMTRGSGVIANADAGALWNNPSFAGGGHAVTVIGAEYDDAGKLTHVHINDTGTGRCGQRMPASQFFNGVNSHPSGKPKLNVTNNPIF